MQETSVALVTLVELTAQLTPAAGRVPPVTRMESRPVFQVELGLNPVPVRRMVLRSTVLTAETTGAAYLKDEALEFVTPQMEMDASPEPVPAAIWH